MHGMVVGQRAFQPTCSEIRSSHHHTRSEFITAFVPQYPKRLPVVRHVPQTALQSRRRSGIALPRSLRIRHAVATSATAQLTDQRVPPHDTPARTDEVSSRQSPLHLQLLRRMPCSLRCHVLMSDGWLVIAQDARRQPSDDAIEAESLAALDWPAICAQVGRLSAYPFACQVWGFTGCQQCNFSVTDTKQCISCL